MDMHALCDLHVQSIPDMTGREDLVTHLRSHLLNSTARKLGCTKVVRGDCADTLAMRLVSEAAKVREHELAARPLLMGWAAALLVLMLHPTASILCSLSTKNCRSNLLIVCSMLMGTCQ
jgi:hypothetical protein